MKGHSESERNAASDLKGVAVAQMGCSDRLLGRHSRSLLLLILCLGAVPRFWSLDWDWDSQTGIYQSVHPDEATLLSAAGDLRHTLKPSITSYGALSLYLPWSATQPLAWFGVEPFDFADDTSARWTVLLARSISAAAAVLSLWLTWALGLRLGGSRAGLLGAALLAVCVLPIQQAHFYTVDTAFTAATLAGLLAAVRLMSNRSVLAWVLAGLMVGATAALRINGLALLVPVTVVGLMPLLHARTPAIIRHTAGRGAIVGAAALLTLVMLQPYMILDPAHYFAYGGINNLRSVLTIAVGDMSRIWTLYDSAQTPVLFHLGSLLFHGMGPLLQVAGLAGFVYLAWRRQPADIVVLVWSVTLILLLSRLEAKNARYMLPLVPVLCVMAAVVLDAGLRRARGAWRTVVLMGTTVTLLSTAMYGLAYLRVLSSPNSRLEAVAALPGLFPEGGAVGYEKTGVSLDGLAPDAGIDWQPDIAGEVFNLDPFLLRSDAAVLLVDWLSDLDGLALVDVARYRHFAAVPGRYPVLAEFYRRLHEGELGFEVIAEFHTDPGLGPWSLEYREDTDPSFYGFDHPLITVLRRGHEAGIEALKAAWVEDLRQDRDGFDMYVLEAGRQLRADELASATAALDLAAENRPDHFLVKLMRCEIELRSGRTDKAGDLWRSILREMGPPDELSLWEHEQQGLVYAGRTLTRLGATALGARCLEIGSREH